MEGSRDKVLENTLVNGVDLLGYATRFEWDKAKYPTTNPVTCLKDLINKDVLQVAKELKSRSAAYNSGKASLQSLERKLDGTLQNRSLTDLIRKEDLVVSEYLTTLLVFVPRRSYAHWESTYECLSDLVVPRSSR
ncbi:unnamed protein product [Tetraodon nigroviridis]|nr:unnamed protein product [Tetraodon nigroviridis]